VGLPIESDTDDEEQGKMRSVCMFCLPNNLSGGYRLSRDKGDESKHEREKNKNAFSQGKQAGSRR
jgi:hypothetical protein